MKHNVYVYLLIVMFLICLIPAFGFAQGGATVSTSVDVSTLKVGDEVSFSIELDLHGAASRGGYIDIAYDPAVLRCVEVDNRNIFGRPEGACSDAPLLRIKSEVLSMGQPKNFSSPMLFAVLTLKAIQSASKTDIRIAAESSQIFGTRAGDILDPPDRSTIQQFTIEEASSSPGSPGSGDDPFGVPEPSTLLLLVIGMGGLFWFLYRR